ncbi:hypothetical protein SAMN05421858_0094 [Haladaptatus litoreus]|uniref:ABM domain-containing protein n=1 Tax=Haladaptatus litoreus TaxID=553468 RepID=A0A1N6UU18_9EURY|nr:DUF6176 family protein [Haladaptatus litoreus]SIQ69031.1 hypothetical protein SAMN05421858_0094 [Haladaptatus litoreus]
MTDVVLTKQKIEPGKTERLKEWSEEVRERKDEAVETLQNEGMHAESAFIERTDDGDFLVYYMKAEDIHEVYEAFENSTHEIDREHEEVMRETLESVEDVGEYELLYHLDNPDLP